MPKPNYAFLGELAAGYLGEAVTCEPKPDGRLGSEVGWNGKAYFMLVSPALGDDPARLLEVFLHEVGHVKLGHINRGKTYRPAVMALDAKTINTRLAQEDAADEWARDQMAQLPKAAKAVLLRDIVEDE